MICKIADLIVDIPAAGGMTPRCQAYLTDQNLKPDIVLSADRYHPERYPNADYNMVCYMESAWAFYGNLVRFNGFYLHASAVEYEGKAYLFSGPSTVGKSTHTKLWQKVFGPSVQVFNDDKPALRLVDGTWYAYGTPWCGKDGINQNKKVPLAGICFLSQAKENRIYRLTGVDAIRHVLSQTMFRYWKAEDTQKLLQLLDDLLRNIAVYKLENLPNEAAAQLSYETMRPGANNE